jgi:MoaA/NifB/PqqE/SkfB family radical SAM enzyme
MTMVTGSGCGVSGPLGMIWAELGLECQLECVHCYAGAGPRKGFGTMTGEDWENAIRDAAGLGARHVTFIGGEPTLSAALPGLTRLATGLGLTAEIYTNMVRVTPGLWELFALPGVSLAASWYTSDRARHAAITGGHDTWRQTRANIAEAVRRGIPIRAGIVDGIVPGQRAGDAERELRTLGVGSTGTDRLRDFGRGTVPDLSQACGRCGLGRLAVLSDGTVTPCPMTRWLAVGNVRDASLASITGSLASMSPQPARTGRECDPDCRPGIGCGPLCTPYACKPNVG